MLFVVSVVLLWFLIRFNLSGRRLKPSAFYKLMENENPVTIINSTQAIVIKPPTVIIKIRPSQMIVVKPAPAAIIQPKMAAVFRVQPAKAVTVSPPERGAWDERGWTRATRGGRDIYEGYYLVGTRRFRGRIESHNDRQKIAAYIYNPPREVKRHRHGACFQLVKDGWFYLHWSRPARSVDDAILYMERVLDESLNG
jgi:hypothetical protein